MGCGVPNSLIIIEDYIYKKKKEREERQNFNICLYII
jgi:hypothetical protein